jgi:hypothetical protein
VADRLLVEITQELLKKRFSAVGGSHD